MARASNDNHKPVMRYALAIEHDAQELVPGAGLLVVDMYYRSLPEVTGTFYALKALIERAGRGTGITIAIVAESLRTGAIFTVDEVTDE